MKDLFPADTLMLVLVARLLLVQRHWQVDRFHHFQLEISQGKECPRTILVHHQIVNENAFITE